MPERCARCMTVIDDADDAAGFSTCADYPECVFVPVGETELRTEDEFEAEVSEP